MICEELLKKHSLPQAGTVGDGWVPLVEELIVGLKTLGWDGDLGQIKEKFGGLRFYVGSATTEMYELIDEAEQKSFKICEECGAPGKTRDTAWIRTLCGAHVREGVR